MKIIVEVSDTHAMAEVCAWLYQMCGSVKSLPDGSLHATDRALSPPSLPRTRRQMRDANVLPFSARRPAGTWPHGRGAA